jgi:hypothetical protein
MNNQYAENLLSLKRARSKEQRVRSWEQGAKCKELRAKGVVSNF